MTASDGLSFVRYKESLIDIRKKHRSEHGGVSPSTRVVEDKSWGDFWKGTVQEINEKYCGGAKTKLTADLEAKHAPYKAALKADKLRLMIDTKTGTVYS